MDYSIESQAKEGRGSAAPKGKDGGYETDGLDDIAIAMAVALREHPRTDPGSYLCTYNNRHIHHQQTHPSLLRLILLI